MNKCYFDCRAMLTMKIKYIKKNTLQSNIHILNLCQTNDNGHLTSDDSTG